MKKPDIYKGFTKKQIENLEDAVVEYGMKHLMDYVIENEYLAIIEDENGNEHLAIKDITKDD